MDDGENDVPLEILMIHSRHSVVSLLFAIRRL